MNPICVYHDVLKLNVKTPVNEKVILISNTSLSRDAFPIPVIRIYAPPFIRPPKTLAEGLRANTLKRLYEYNKETNQDVCYVFLLPKSPNKP